MSEERGLKTCRVCRESKAPADYYRHYATCKVCVLASQAAWRAARRKPRPSREEAFWARVAKSDGCWVWIPKHTGSHGVGLFAFRGRRQIASRAAWELTYGPIPDGLLVCHRCDNPPCVRPEHLFLGTPRDNMHDMIAKGRARSVRGEAHPAHRITVGDVLEIRRRVAAGEAVQKVAEAFGLKSNNVRQIAAGRTWRHLPGAVRGLRGKGGWRRTTVPDSTLARPPGCSVALESGGDRGGE